MDDIDVNKMYYCNKIIKWKNLTKSNLQSNEINIDFILKSKKAFMQDSKYKTISIT